MIEQPDPKRWRKHLPSIHDFDLFMGNLSTPKSGYVYLMFSPSYGLYKIGYTRNIKNRLAALKIKHGADLELIHWLPHHAARSLEKHFHYMSSGYRIHGEWFEFPADDRGLWLLQRMARSFERVHQADVQHSMGVFDG